MAKPLYVNIRSKREFVLLQNLHNGGLDVDGLTEYEKKLVYTSEFRDDALSEEQLEQIESDLGITKRKKLVETIKARVKDAIQKSPIQG